MRRTQPSPPADRFAYRGYFVIKSHADHWTVTKDGHTICRPLTPEAAKAAIDGLLD